MSGLLLHIKRFFEWIGLKAKLDLRQDKVPYVSAGEIWWASLGENVGYEINGKNSEFTRPVVIFKKLSRGFYFVIPLTTQVREGTWYASFRIGNKEQFACLHQARSIDYRRLHSRLGRLDAFSYGKIESGFLKLYFKNIPRHF